MDEINPYATPLSGQDAKPPRPSPPRGYRFYKWLSLGYSSLMGLLSGALLVRESEYSSGAAVVILTIINAPLVSYLLVAGRWRRLFYSWSSLQLLGVLALVAFAVDRLQPGDTFGLFLAGLFIGANATSLLASVYFTWRLQPTDKK